MRPLPTAPFLPDLGEVLRKATEEGFKQGLAWVRMDQEEALAKTKREREQSPVGLFVAQDDDPKKSTGAARTTLSSGPYAGLQSAKKRTRETVDPKEEPTPRFGPAKKKVSKKCGTPQNVHTINSRTMEQGPEWYNTINLKERYPRGDLQDLKYLFTLINNVQQDARTGKDVTQILNNIRQRLGQMEFLPSLSLVLVKKSGLLHHQGLSLIFENRVQGVLFPSDIRADADILFRKWMSGQIDPHLLRGIVTTIRTAKEGKTYKSHSLDKDFAGKVSCNYVGAGNLVNGQWWPLQLCAMRDGAHGEVEAGIHGQKGHGVYSVVISGGGYANIDSGDSIKYCGTQGTENSPSLGTSLMLKSYETQQPIRLLRSASLPATNAYRPVRGLRYDGLYSVTSHEILDTKTSMYRFAMSRLWGQDPIRYSGDGMVPSKAQILELDKVRKQIG